MRKDYRDFDTDKVILVTGAAGFIGFHLSKALLEMGYKIVGYDNLNDYYDVKLKEDRLDILRQFDKFSFIKGDLADAELLHNVFAEYKPNIVVNLAAQAGVRYSITNPKAYMDSNMVGFFNILEECRKSKEEGQTPVEHLLFASSSSVYGNQKKTPFSVEDKVDEPISFYAATKKSNELMAHAYSHIYGIPATGLRFFTVYGPYGRPDMAYFSFSDKIMSGQTIKVFNHGDLYRDFTYVDDIVTGIKNILHNFPVENSEGNRFKVYNIGNNQPVNLLNFIEVLEEKLGVEAKKEFLPMQQGDVYQTYADVEDLMKDFDFKPSTTIEDGLEKFVAWYKEYYSSYSEEC